MSIKIMSWVLDHSPYEGKARLVHVVLADHANDDGKCWPSQSKIAARAGCSVEHVRVTVRQMEADGFIQIIEESTRQGKAHTYLLKSPNHLVPKSTGEGPQVDRQTSPNPSPSNRKEPSSKPSNTLAQQVERDFNEFWETYPRRVGKAAAKRAYIAARKAVEGQTILHGTWRLRDDPNRVEAFTPHPATWLNRGGWDDDPLPTRETERTKGQTHDQYVASLIMQAVNVDIPLAIEGASWNSLE